MVCCRCADLSDHITPMARNLAASELQIKAAAYLCSIGKSQKELAAELRVSQPTVSRLLMHARRRGLMTTTHNLSDGDLREIESVLYPQFHELSETLDRIASKAGVSRVNSLRVFWAGQLPNDGIAMPE